MMLICSLWPSVLVRFAELGSAGPSWDSVVSQHMVQDLACAAAVAWIQRVHWLSTWRSKVRTFAGWLGVELASGPMRLDWIRQFVQTPWQEVLDWEKQCVESLSVRARACGLCGLFQDGFDQDREAEKRAAKSKVRSSHKRGRGGDEIAEGSARQGSDNWHGVLLADLAPEQLEDATKLARAVPHYDRFICKRRPNLMWRCSKCRQPGHAGSNARFVPDWSEEYVKLLIDMPYVWVHSLGFFGPDLRVAGRGLGVRARQLGRRSLVQGPLLQLQTAAMPEQPFPVSMNAIAQHLRAHHPLYQCLVPLYQQPRTGDRVMIPPAAWMHIIRCQRNRNPLARTHEGLDLDTVLITKLK